MLGLTAVVALGALVGSARAQTYSATYLPSNAPNHSEQGQAGTNQCGTGSSQSSMCQNAYMNSVDDFCVFAPPEPGAGNTIGETERIEVAWCMKSGYGTRLIPDGTISGAHFVQTPDYVQISGVGDLTKINIPAGDEGGELDPHGATETVRNPIGGLVFSDAFGKLEQIHEWTNFVSDTEFCFRACKDGPKAPALCMHIYDTLGCFWNMPGDYDAGVFERCLGDSGEPMGVYGTSTFYQGEPSTPAAHPAPPTSQCTPFASIKNGAAAAGPSPAAPTTTSTPPAGGSVTIDSSPNAYPTTTASSSGSGSGSGSGARSTTSVSSSSTSSGGSTASAPTPKPSGSTPGAPAGSSSSSSKTGANGAVQFGAPLAGVGAALLGVFAGALLL